VGVRGADQDAFLGDLGLGGDLFSRLLAHQGVDAQQIADDEGEPGFAVVEHEAAGVQFVVDVGGADRRETADDVSAECRGDVARCGAGPELLGGDGGSRREYARDTKHETCRKSTHGG
jgi:hypothetical protein